MSRDRSDPRISICKHAEYMVAPPGRRRTILRDQKFPAAFKASSYREAYSALADVLVNGKDGYLVDSYIEDWRSRAPKSPFDAKSTALCIDALTGFQAILSSGALDKFSFAPGIQVAYLELEGVALSVRPDTLITGSDVGALKIYLSKTVPLTKDAAGRPGSASYAGAALHLWAETRFGGAPAARCVVLDVFAGAVHVAPARYVQRREDLRASCSEIAAVWPSITKPAGTPEEEMPF